MTRVSSRAAKGRMLRMPTEVHDNPERSRYELYVDGEIAGVAEYSVRGNTIVFPHTVIDRDKRGRGLGAVLVRTALDDVRESGRTVVPQCWYVAEFIDENPGYRDLVA